MSVVVTNGNITYIKGSQDPSSQRTLKNTQISKYLPVAAKLVSKAVSTNFLETIVQSDPRLGALLDRYPVLLRLFDQSVPRATKGEIVANFISQHSIDNDLKNRLVAISQDLSPANIFVSPLSMNKEALNTLDKISRTLGYDVYQKLLDHNLITDDVGTLVKQVFSPSDLAMLEDKNVTRQQIVQLLSGVLPESNPTEINFAMGELYGQAGYSAAALAPEELPIESVAVGTVIAQEPTIPANQTSADLASGADANKSQYLDPASAQSGPNVTQDEESNKRLVESILRKAGEPVPIPAQGMPVPSEEGPVDSGVSTPTTDPTVARTMPDEGKIANDLSEAYKVFRKDIDAATPGGFSRQKISQQVFNLQKDVDNLLEGRFNQDAKEEYDLAVKLAKNIEYVLDNAGKLRPSLKSRSKLAEARLKIDERVLEKRGLAVKEFDEMAQHRPIDLNSGDRVVQVSDEDRVVQGSYEGMTPTRSTEHIVHHYEGLPKSFETLTDNLSMIRKLLVHASEDNSYPLVLRDLTAIEKDIEKSKLTKHEKTVLNDIQNNLHKRAMREYQRTPHFVGKGTTIEPTGSKPKTRSMKKFWEKNLVPNCLQEYLILRQ